MTEGNRITIAAITQRAVLGYAAVLHVARVVVGLLANQQQGLLRQPIVGHFARGGVRLAIDFLHPLPRLLVQIGQRIELNAWPEVLFSVWWIRSCLSSLAGRDDRHAV